MASQYRPVRGIKAPNAGGAGFNPYAAGNKVYGGGRPFPNVGKGGAVSKVGYAEREAKRKAIMSRQGGK